MKKKLFSIVLPIHNEFHNLKKLIHEWDYELKKKKNFNFEFVLVEDGSTDGTKDLIKILEKKYKIINLSSNIKRGYGRAVLDGIYNSNGYFVLCTDSDNQIKVGSLIKNLENLPKKNEFLIGNRSPRKDPINRIIYSKIFRIFHLTLFGKKISDPSCPFVIGLNSEFRKLPKNLLLKMKEGFWWGFVATCTKYNKNLYEVPIKHYKRTAGEAGYKIKNLLGIIYRNCLGLIKIKISN